MWEAGAGVRDDAQDSSWGGGVGADSLEWQVGQAMLVSLHKWETESQKSGTQPG